MAKASFARRARSPVGSVDFSGATNGAVLLANSSMGGWITQQCTFSIWIYFTSTAATYECCYVEPSGTGWTGIKLVSGILEADSNVSGTKSMGSPTLNRWNYVAIVCTSTTYQGFRIQQGDNAFTASVTGTVTANVASLVTHIGNGKNLTAAPSAYISSFIAYNYALSLPELNRQAQQRAPIRQGGCMSYVPLHTQDECTLDLVSGARWSTNGTIGTGVRTQPLVPPVPEVLAPKAFSFITLAAALDEGPLIVVPPPPDIFDVLDIPGPQGDESQFIFPIVSEDGYSPPPQPPPEPPYVAPGIEAEFIFPIISEDGYATPPVPEQPPYVGPGFVPPGVDEQFAQPTGIGDETGYVAPQAPEQPPNVTPGIESEFIFPIVSEDGYAAPQAPEQPPYAAPGIEEQFLFQIVTEDGYTPPPVPEQPPYAPPVEEQFLFQVVSEDGYVPPQAPEQPPYVAPGVESEFIFPIVSEDGYVPPQAPEQPPPVIFIEEQFVGIVLTEDGYVVPPTPEQPPYAPPVEEQYVAIVLSEDGYVVPLAPEQPPYIPPVEEQFSPVTVALAEDGYTVPEPPDDPPYVAFGVESEFIFPILSEDGYMIPPTPEQPPYVGAGVESEFISSFTGFEETGYTPPPVPEQPPYAPPVEEQFAAPTGMVEDAFVPPPAPEQPPYVAPGVEEQFLFQVVTEDGYTPPAVPEQPPPVTYIEEQFVGIVLTEDGWMAPVVPEQTIPFVNIDEQFAAPTGIGEETGYVPPLAPEQPPYAAPGIEEQFVAVVLTEDGYAPPPIPEQPSPYPFIEEQYVAVVLSEDGVVIFAPPPDVPPQVIPIPEDNAGVVAAFEETPGPFAVQPEFTFWSPPFVIEEIASTATAWDEDPYVVPVYIEIDWKRVLYIEEAFPSGVIPPPPPLPINPLLLLGGAGAEAWLSPRAYGLYASGVLWELGYDVDNDPALMGGLGNLDEQTLEDDAIGYLTGKWASVTASEEAYVPRMPNVSKALVLRSSEQPVLTGEEPLVEGPGKAEADYIIVPVGAYGSTVRTAAAGHVSFVYDAAKGGLCGIVAGDDGNKYIHIGLSVSEGPSDRWVRAGDVIGKAGKIAGVTDIATLMSIASAKKQARSRRLVYGLDRKTALVSTAASLVFMVLGRPDLAVTFVGGLLYGQIPDRVRKEDDDD